VTVSCAKTAEPIEMPFDMLSWVGPGNMYYSAVGASTYACKLHGYVDVPTAVSWMCLAD